jgi:hypothetical protein
MVHGALLLYSAYAGCVRPSNLRFPRIPCLQAAQGTPAAHRKKLAAATAAAAAAAGAAGRGAAAGRKVAGRPKPCLTKGDSKSRTSDSESSESESESESEDDEDYTPECEGQEGSDGVPSAKSARARQGRVHLAAEDSGPTSDDMTLKERAEVGWSACPRYYLANSIQCVTISVTCSAGEYADIFKGCGPAAHDASANQAQLIVWGVTSWAALIPMYTGVATLGPSRWLQVPQPKLRHLPCK